MFLNSRRILLTAVFFLTAGVVDSTAFAQENGQYVLVGQHVAVYNLAGKMKVEGGSGSEVVVEVTLVGDDSGELEIESGMIDGRPTLRVIYPSSRIVYTEVSRFSRTTIRVRRDGTFGGSPIGSRRVTITGSGRGLRAYADITVKVPEGKKVATYIGVGRIDAENIAGDFRLDTVSGNVKVDGVRGPLLVDTGSGRVTVNDAEGDVDIDTGSGRVDLSGITGDELRVDTGSGRVKGNRIEVRHIDIDTGSGGINIERVQGRDIRLDTGSGSVELDLMSNIRSLVIDTGSGGVTVHVPSTLGADIEIDVGSGGISVDVPIEYFKKTRTYIRGQIGDGNGRIYIDTGSGSVRIYPR
ncbi:MAG: DUF4097 family beta strand repeat protein [Candidatus Latescibacteria bacterium]|nr:DUF4097 family beta strand repeat protein [Candidatus Latescibacterota bacterium]